MEFRWFFYAIILCTFLEGQSHAQSMDLYASANAKSIADMASIDIKVNHFSSIISFQASINWNPALMTFTGITNFGIADFNEENFGDVPADQGHLRFVWEPKDANARTLADSTVLFTANFEMITTDPTPVAVSFEDKTSDPPFPIEFANSSSEALTVNTSDGSIVYEPKVTGLTIESNPISAFPNPFNESINISMGNEPLKFVKIYDIKGNLILEKHNLKQPFADIHLKNSPNGIYLIQLRVNDRIITKKIIKNSAN